MGFVGALSAAGVLTGFLPNPVVAGDPKASGLNEPRDSGPLLVKVIKPRRENSFQITTLLPVATIEPFYQAGLRARVSGEVRFVSKDIGESVQAGELLVELDTPDLRELVLQRTAIIVQREKELSASQAELGVARAAIDAAKVAVKLKAVEVNQAKDVVSARKIDLDGVRVLFEKGSAEKFRLDSSLLDYQAAVRGAEAAEVEVEKAGVDLAGKTASWEKAKADVELKRALVDVARQDRDAAAVQLSYSRLYAPFDGVIVARHADPGKEVFAGPGGPSVPLLTVARTDLVTVVGKVPDNAAPFVTSYTQAAIEFAQLPGMTLHGQITRFSRAIDPSDQSMRVEVDVFNGSRSAYRAMLTRSAVKHTISPLIPFDRLASLSVTGVGSILSRPDYKGWHQGNALTPEWGADGMYPTIVPGTTATMRLELQSFAETFLIPTQAVYGRAGQLYLLVVEGDATRQVPVAVQMYDGSLAKVAAILPSGAGRQVTRELTGNELIVLTRQLEVGEGQKVKPVLEKW